jgi:hypothetical protein
VVDWDYKSIVVLAIAGGIGNVVSRYMNETGKRESFNEIIDRYWTWLFGNGTLQGSHIAFALPSKSMPDNGQRFSCDGNNRQTFIGALNGKTL